MDSTYKVKMLHLKREYADFSNTGITFDTRSSMWNTTKEAGTKLRAKMTQMAWVRLIPICRLK